MSFQFYETRMGQKFFEATVPRVADALVSIATSLEQLANPIQEVESPHDALLARGQHLLDDRLHEKWLIQQVPLLSTSHMRENDNTMLQRLLEIQEHPYVGTAEGGWMLYLGGVDCDRGFWSDQVELELFTIIDQAASQGAQYIRFDKDGPVVLRFPVFDW